MPPYDPDEDLDRDAPQERDLEEGEDGDYIDCPSCGRTFHEDAPRCPSCGYWLTAESPAMQRSRRWFWPVLVAVLVATILMMWSPF